MILSFVIERPKDTKSSRKHILYSSKDNRENRENSDLFFY